MHSYGVPASRAAFAFIVTLTLGVAASAPAMAGVKGSKGLLFFQPNASAALAVLMDPEVETMETYSGGALILTTNRTRAEALAVATVRHSSS
jgi:hypothetical protein